MSVFQTVAEDLLELAPVHFGPGASPDWPPPEAAHINQGDNEQRDAMRRAAQRKARKVAARGVGSDAASGASVAASEEEAAAAAAGGGAESSGEEDDADEGLTGWAARPGNGWLRDNPTGVPTERELGTNAAGGHCWRALLQRKAAPPAAADH